MKRILSILFFGIFFLGCNESPKVDTKKILESSCSKCHNLSMPPVIHKIELAPPMMAVVFHLKDFIKTPNPSDHKSKFISFVSDYILHPTKDKSFCDETSIKRYGLMPSLKDQLNNNEAEQISAYIYDKYDSKKFYKIQKEKAFFESLPKGEQLVRKNGCLSCHDILKVKIAPSFQQISKIASKDEMKNSLLNGSKGRYKNFRKTTMPPLGKNISSKDLEDITTWILTIN